MSEWAGASIGHQDLSIRADAIAAGMTASSKSVDRPVEAEAASGDVVQDRLGADFVEADAHRLGGVEGADDGAVADPRQPGVPLDPLLIPAHLHEHMFANRADGPGMVGPLGSLMAAGGDPPTPQFTSSIRRNRRISY